MKLCLKNLAIKVLGIILGTWWILLVMGMIHLTKISPDIEWLIACGLVGGWLLVGMIAVISALCGFMLVIRGVDDVF
jgi:hypothetical protein